MIECVKVISQGFSHKAQNKPCQDSASIVQEEGYRIISVADGHGGERYFRSEIGSRIAVEIVETEFKNLLGKMKLNSGFSKRTDLEKTLKVLEQNIIKSWKNRVEEHCRQNEWTSDEKELIEKLNIKFDNKSDDEKKSEEICKVKLYDAEVLRCYGTTLLSVLYVPEKFLKKAFWIAIQIGDGLTFALDENGEEFYPIPEDESLGFGYTTSLCSSTAAESFRHAYGFSKLNAIVVCSDGVADSFAKDKFGDFVKKIYGNINEHGREAVQKELQEFFPKLSEQGSGDDVSLAGVFEVENGNV